MRANIKKAIIITAIILAIILPLWHYCFGLFYERKWFRFDWSLDETEKMLQDYHKAMYFLGYNMEFNGPNYYAHATVVLDKKYETYALYNISFEWDNNKTVYEINKTLNFEYDKYDYNKVYNSDEFLEMWGISIPEVNTWYEINYLEGFPVINFSKIFKGKRVGEYFPCKITVSFSFDNELPMILTYYCNIHVDRNNYMGIIDMMLYF